MRGRTGGGARRGGLPHFTATQQNPPHDTDGPDTELSPNMPSNDTVETPPTGNVTLTGDIVRIATPTDGTVRITSTPAGNPPTGENWTDYLFTFLDEPF